MGLEALFDLFGQVLLDEGESPLRIVIHIDGQDLPDLRYLQFDIHLFQIHLSYLIFWDQPHRPQFNTKSTKDTKLTKRLEK